MVSRIENARFSGAYHGREPEPDDPDVIRPVEYGFAVPKSLIKVKDLVQRSADPDPEKVATALKKKHRIGFLRGMVDVGADARGFIIFEEKGNPHHHFLYECHGRKYEFCHHPLLIFGEPNTFLNEIRKWAIWISEWNWCEYVITAAIFGNCVLMGLPFSYDPDSATEQEKTLFLAVNAVCCALFSAECVLKVIARGLIIGDAPDACYLQEYANWFDFIILIISLVELLMADSGSSQSSGSGKLILLRTFRILRPLRTIKKLPVLAMIISTLTESIPRLIHWFLNSIFMASLCVILGMSLFGTVYWHRCRLTENPIMNATSGLLEWPIDPAQQRFCGGRYSCQPTASGEPTFCGSPVDSIDGVISGYDPWPEIYDYVHADFGYSGFQTFNAAMTTVFRIATMEGWSRIMYRHQDGRGDFYALMYFISLLLFGGLVLLKLAVAILWQVFETKMRASLDLDESDIPQEIKLMKIDDLTAKVHELEKDHKAKSIYQQMDQSTGAYATIRSICLSVVSTPSFDGTILTVIALNCIVLAFDAYPAPDKLLIKFADQVNVFCTLVFTFEAVLRMISFGFNYFRDYFNLFDLTLVVVSIVELTIGGSATVSSLRVSRLLRLFRIFGHSVPMAVLFRVFQKASILSGNFCFIVVLVLMGWTLVALNLFYDNPDDSSVNTQIRFENFLWAFVAMFQLLCGHRWHEIMVEHANERTDDVLLTVFFVAVFVTCHLILMNLFLAMFVAAFAVAREEIIHSYRLKMNEFHQRKKAASYVARDTMVQNKPAQLETPQHHLPDLQWPCDVVKIRHLPKGSGTGDMNVLRMMRIKRKALSRAEAKGEGSLQREASRPMKGLTYEDEEKKRDSIVDLQRYDSFNLDAFSSEQNASNEAPVDNKRSVSFKQLEIEVPEDSEVQAVHAATLMNSPEHRALPPSDLSCEASVNDAASAGVPCPNAFAASSANSASCNLELCVEPTLGHARHTRRNVEGLLQQDTLVPSLISLPRLALQGRCANAPPCRIRDEMSDDCSTGLRRRHRQVEADTQYAPDFAEAYRRSRARSKYEDATSAFFAPSPQQRYCQSDRRAGLGSAIRYASKASSACAVPMSRQSEVLQVADRGMFHQSPTRPFMNVSNRLHLAVSEDVEGTMQREICLPVRDASRESCGSDYEAPAHGHHLVPVGRHSASPVSADQRSTAEQNAELIEALGPSTVLALKLVRQPWFDPLILIFIGISSVSLAIESPYTAEDSNIRIIMEILDLVICFFFIGEMLVKFKAYGLRKQLPLIPEPPYFGDGWNWLDSMIVVSSIIDLCSKFVSKQASFVKVLRAFRLMRSLRPLRFVQRNKGMKILVEALIKSFPTLLRTLIVSALFYIGFAILFMSLLKGQLWRCSLDPHGDLRPEIVTRDDCENAGGDWINARSHFDQIGNSLVTVVHMGTGEGWVEVLQDMVRSVGIDRQPRKDASVQYAFLVIAFVALSNFFLVNLFVGVLIDQYCVVRDIVQGVELSNQQEKHFIAVQKHIFSMRGLLRQADKLEGLMVKQREQLAWIVRSRAFEAFIFTCILANSLNLCMVHPTMTSSQRSIIAGLSLAFITIFNLEAGLKLFIFQIDYFKESWNVFDFVMVLGSDISVIAYSASGGQGDMVRALEAFRVIRVLRLVRVFKFLMRQCRALLMLVPALMNISCLLILLLFMYAVAGVSLFATVMPGNTVNEAANFESFGMSLLMVLRIMTGESWHDVMYDLVEDRPNCTADYQSPEDLKEFGPRGCGTALAYPYFVSFTCFASIIMLNLIIAVVLDGYQSVERAADFEFYTTQVHDLAQEWKKLDTTSSGYLTLTHALSILVRIPAPVGFKGWPAHKVKYMLRRVPMFEDNKIHFRDVVVVAVKRLHCWFNRLREQKAIDVELNRDILEYWYSQFPGVPHPEKGKKHLFVAHAILKRKLIDFIARTRHKNAIRAQLAVLEENANMQAQGKTKAAKAAAMLLEQEPGQKLGGLNAAGLPLRMPGGDQQGAFAEETRMPVSVEALLAGSGLTPSGSNLRTSASTLQWPPVLPAGDNKHVEGAMPRFRSCQLVGSGFDDAV